MRKSILLAAVLLAVISAGASAVDIKTFDTAPGIQYVWNSPNGYNVAGISDDGATIIATLGTKATTYDVATGAVQTQWTNNSYGRGLGIWSGVGGASTIIVSAGAGASGANPPKANFGRTAPTLGVLRDSSGTANASTPAAFNSTSLDFATGNGWMVGRGQGTQVGTGQAWRIMAGNITNMSGTYTPNAMWQQAGTPLNGVSTAGIAAAESTTYGAALADLTSNTAGSITDIPAFAGAAAGVNGKALAISAGAVLGTTPAGYAGGYFAPGSGDDTKHGFRYALGGATSEELLPIGGDIPGSIQEANVYDISDNGIAVGYSFTAGGPGNIAAIWLPGETTAQVLSDYLVSSGATMPANFGRLVTGVSITAVPNVDGLYSIAGQYLTNDTVPVYKAFVATIPEPATMAFLALGGLAMLRRRR